MYGEIPGGGGFGNNTEYEVAASNMAEAAHCILGSLAKLTDNTPFKIEKGHIKEEMGIIEHAMREYTKNIYLTRVFQGKYALDTIKSVRKAAPILAKKAKSAKSRINKDLPKEIKKLSIAAYDFLILLADKLYLSVKRIETKVSPKFNDGEFRPIEPFILDMTPPLNAYKDSELKTSVALLRQKVDWFLKLPDNGSKSNPYGGK